MTNNKILFSGIIIAGIVLVIIAFIAINQLPRKTTETTTTTTLLSKTPIVVENDDIIEVNYIGGFDNGTVFDTSYRDIAIENNIYDPARKYPPLKFKVGSGQVIPGFDDAVMGMKAGEEKTVKIPPTLAYGKYDPKLVMEVNRTQKSPRTQNVTLDKFLTVVGKQPFVGMEFTVSEAPWPLTVEKITNVTRTMDISLAKFKKDTGEDPGVGKSFMMSNITWPVTVLNFTNTTVAINLIETLVAIRHNPSGNEILDTMLGNATVSVTDSEIIITANPVAGKNYEGLRVIAVNETTITADLNHELAGKILVFKVKVESITKGSSPGESPPGSSMFPQLNS